MKVLLANPRGFCAGVERAIASVERALDRHGPPVYVRHEIVHNRHVVEALRRRGAVFVEELADVPDGALVMWSAHGVAPALDDEARRRRLKVIDATCPLVTKVHLEVAEHSRAGRTVFVIGHRDHPEVQGTVGHYRGAGRIEVIENEAEAAAVAARGITEAAYVTQTTLSLDDTARTLAVLCAGVPRLGGPHKDDICYATQNRQRAVRDLARQCDAVIVVGAAHSSNSVRLREVAQAAGTRAWLVDCAEAVERDWIDGCETLGVTSGASVPEELVQALLERLRAWWPALELHSIGMPEAIHFRLPRALETEPAPAAAALHD
jgi:4-hydroxy-3-methylbut-2-en-1-yl diphosphate reductase